MARKRMIDPNIWESEDFSCLSSLDKLVFIGLFSLADDEGYGKANPKFLRNSLFPYNDDIRTTDIEKSLCNIAAHMSVVFYRVDDGKQYYYLTNWKKWQSIQKPKSSIIPKPIDTDTIQIQYLYGSSTVQVLPKGKEKKGIGIEKEGNIGQGELFEIFWNEYPKKIQRSRAEHIWSKLDITPELFEVIIQKVKEYKIFKKNEPDRFIKNPSNWLEEKAWEDNYNITAPDERGTIF